MKRQKICLFFLISICLMHCSCEVPNILRMNSFVDHSLLDLRFHHIRLKMRAEALDKFLIRLPFDSAQLGAAQYELDHILNQIDTSYVRIKNVALDSCPFVFPVDKYDTLAIGGYLGNGFVLASQYNFFNPKSHGGHPAQDIFIFDTNHDSRDDHTLLPVQIVSMTHGVVVRTVSAWDTSSSSRGGKLVYTYSPESQSLYYYAHLSQVNVAIGQILKAGDVLGQLGRTGVNAYASRSQTHLHCMQIKCQRGNPPRPINLYAQLMRSKRSNNQSACMW